MELYGELTQTDDFK